ncbi:MAG TPA: hypothetical protein VGI95_03390 [Caulobacteraceae bacterium]|jgi:hypothetical protein
MATTKKTKAAKASERASKPKAGSKANSPTDAIALLEADHREVEALFERYETAKDADDKAEIAAQVCLALKVHAQIEEGPRSDRGRTLLSARAQGHGRHRSPR